MKIFVGSTIADLRQHRRMLMDTLTTLDSRISVIAMELFGSDPNDPVSVSRAKVREADLYIGVFGFRYGSTDPATKMSITELEYRTALTDRLPTYIYLMSKDHALSLTDLHARGARKIRSLRAELAERHTVQEFTTPEDLGRRVAIDIARYMRSTKRTAAPRAKEEAVDEHINPSHPYLFSHLARRSATAGRYDLTMFIDIFEHDDEVYRARFAEIERVVYQLHSDFPVPIVAMQNWRERFQLKANVWGEFWGRATIYFKKARRRPIVVDRYISLPLPEFDESLSNITNGLLEEIESSPRRSRSALQPEEQG
jgi:hypothetical protein